MESQKQVSSKSSTSTAPSESGPSVAGAFFKDVDEMISMVRFVIDNNPRSSYTRCGHMNYTRTPSKAPNLKMRDDRRGRSANITLNSKKHKDQCGLNSSTGGQGRLPHCFSDLTEEQEVGSLREHIEDMKQKLVEKDELLKQFEAEKNHMISIQSKLDEMNRLVEKKDSLIKSVRLQLANAQMGAADKQASYERMEWELKLANTKVERLEAEVECVQEQISSINIIFQSLSSSSHTIPSPYSDPQSYDSSSEHSFSSSSIDDWDETNVEEAMEKYKSAVAHLKNNQDWDDESMAEAVAARRSLYSLVFPSK